MKIDRSMKMALWGFRSFRVAQRFFARLFRLIIIRGIVQRLSGATNRYTLRTFSRRMFYLSNASERRDEDRKERWYVRTQ